MCCHGNHLKRTDNNYFGSNTHCKIQLYKLLLCLWLAVLVRTTLSEKNIKYKNHSPAVYVRSSLKVHNPLFSVLANCDGMNYNWSVWVSKIKMIGMLLNVVHRQVHKKHITNESVEFHNNSNLLNMIVVIFHYVKG